MEQPMRLRGGTGTTLSNIFRPGLGRLQHRRQSFARVEHAGWRNLVWLGHCQITLRRWFIGWIQHIKPTKIRSPTEPEFSPRVNRFSIPEWQNECCRETLSPG